MKQLNETLVFKRPYVFELSLFVLLMAVELVFLFIGYEGRHSGTIKPAIVLSLIAIFFTYKNRHEQVVLDEKGIRLINGNFLSWCQIHRIEFNKREGKSGLWVYLSNDKVIELELLGKSGFALYDFKQYMEKYHPEIPCESYVRTWWYFTWGFSKAPTGNWKFL